MNDLDELEPRRSTALSELSALRIEAAGLRAENESLRRMLGQFLNPRLVTEGDTDGNA